MDEAVKQVGGIVIAIVVVTLLIGIISGKTVRDTVETTLTEKVSEIADLSANVPESTD